MRLIAFLTVEEFYIGVHPEATSYTVIHHEKVVLDAGPSAREQGVRVGALLAEAKAILVGKGHFVEWREETYSAAQMAWIEVATEFTDAVEPAGQHAAYLDLSGHPRPREVIQRLIETLKNHLNLTARVGLATSRWVAREAAFRGDPAEIAMLMPRRYVAPFPTVVLPLPEELVARLILLGYSQVGTVANLPLDVLIAQFGDVAYDLKQLVMGNGARHVDVVYPANSLASRFVFDGAPEVIEELHNGLRVACDELGEKLKEQDSSVNRVELFLEREDASVEVRRRTFSKPARSTKNLLNALELMMAKLPEYPVEAVRVRLPDVERAARIQLDLDGQKSKSDQAKSIEHAIANARSAFGDTAVLRGSEIKEARWKKVRRAYSVANRWSWG